VSTGVTPAQIVRSVRDWLLAWPASPVKAGSISMAKDPFHPLEILAQSPRGMRLIVAYGGGPSQAVEQNPNAAILEHQISIYLGYSLGLTAAPDAALAIGTDDRPAMLDVISVVDQRVRSLMLPDEVTSRLFRLGGIFDVIMPDGVPLAAQRLQYKIDGLMPDPEQHYEAELSETNTIILPEET
jgi:hypothetical protein